VGERSFGARWWRESLGIASWATRPAASTMGLLGALSLAGCATTWGEQRLEETQLADARDEVDVNVDSLQLQRDEGWDVGQWGTPLLFTGSSDVDVAGTQGWREAMNNLAGALAPSAPALQPYYVPTLFQSLIGPAGQRLRAVMRPIHTADMDADFARGVALRAQFGMVGWPKDTALIVDAPGPRAIAVAAALADQFAPVFTFANWPHPLGVVPAHETVAASLYYLPMFQAAASVRPADAPPLFVLDANRLAHYGDADRQFDNRYFVKLPTAAELAALGVRHVLYVGADARELDDLNAAMVALCQKGVDVKMVALADFVRADDEAAVAQQEQGDDGDDGEDESPPVVDPAWTLAFAWARPLWMCPHYWYRGCWWNGGLFWGDYGFYQPPHGVAGPRPHRGPIVVGPPSVHRAPPLPSHAVWTPAPRATIFSHAILGAPRSPASFGQISVRASRADGQIVGMHATIGASHTILHGGAVVGGVGRGLGMSAARSGSIGRAGFGGFGGG